MKLSSWLPRLSSRRQVLRTVRVVEIFEPRVLMDATLPDLVVQTGDMTETSDVTQIDDVAPSGEVTGLSGDEINPELLTTTMDDGSEPHVIFYSLGGGLKSSPISQFGSREEFGDYLLERALSRYDGLFGQPQWWYGGPIYFRGGNFLADAAIPASLDHSETNVQVNGVDEGDVIENDGQNLYLLNGNDLVILQAYPAGEMRELSRIHFEGYTVAEYLDGDRLTVISQEYDYGDYSFGGGFRFGGAALRIAAPSTVTTVVSVFDVTDRSKPSLEKQTRLDGSYVDSRAFDGKVNVITSNDLSLPAPQIDGTTTIEQPIYYYDEPVFVDDVVSSDSLTIQATGDEPAVDPAASFEMKTQQIEVPVYETREAYIARVREQLDSLIDEALPHYESLSADGLAATGFISEITAINRVNESESDSLLSVVSIDTRGSQPGLVSSSSVITDWTNGIYANRDHLYVFSPLYIDGGTQTRILEFAWANGEREIQLIASGTVDGTLLNQFSADEHDDRLRIATTTSNYDSETGVFSQANNLTILENIDGTLTEVGAVNGFAGGEQIHSVRFDGDRAFIVTFRQVDPLFVFDLSDPTAPVIRGELQVPGVSSYLQVIDENHLLAVGRSTETQSTKVTLYDISNPEAPVQVDEDVLPQWTWSQAEWDAKAIGWFASSGTLAIPTSGYDETDGFHNELVVFHIDVTQSGKSAIEQTGTVEDDGYINRSSFIGDVLYTISNNSVIASEIGNPANVLGQLDFEIDPYLATLTLEPFYVESDDGAADWEYLDLPDSLDEAEGMLVLAAVNVLDGTVRVSLLDAANTVNATLQDGVLTVKARGHQTETVPLDTTSSLLIEGTADADRLNLSFGSSPNSTLTSIVINAGEGNDRVQVLTVDRSVADVLTINGEAGNDRVNVADSVRVGVEINGGDGIDSLTGGAGDDTIDGGAGDDFLSGGRGNDLLLGRDGADLLLGRDGNDTLSGGAGNDRLYGGIGNDAIAGGANNDVLQGESGNDTLLGGDGDDKLSGGQGNDVALGEDGDDTVDGGLGSRDTLSGGPGHDSVLGRRREIHETFSFKADWLDLV